MNPIRWMAALGLVAALGLGIALAVEAEVKKPEACIDEQLCAEKIRYGTEAFNRKDYRQAKAYFRQAVQADPGSLKAWSYYDLSVMYDVAEQVKQAGQVKVSGAPKPGCPEGTAAPAAPAPKEEKEEAPAPAPAIPALPADEGC
jgi:tetratricopeptide (TPR) repeat protein